MVVNVYIVVIPGVGIASWLATASLPHVSEGFVSPKLLTFSLCILDYICLFIFRLCKDQTFCRPSLY